MNAPEPVGIDVFNTSPEQALARIEQWANAATAKAEKYEEVARQTEELRLTAVSRAGEVRVTVRSDGGITGIEFSPKARTVPLPELSAMILRTMRQAQAGIADQVGEVVTEQLGDQDPQTNALMVGELRSRFPDSAAAPAPEPTEDVPPPAASTPPQRDDPVEGQGGENSPW